MNVNEIGTMRIIFESSLPGGVLDSLNETSERYSRFKRFCSNTLNTITCLYQDILDNEVRNKLFTGEM